MSENATDYKPSAHQRQVLEAFQAKDYRISVLQACRDAGIDRCQWYRWMDEKPGFSEWWQHKAEVFFVRKLASVYTALHDSATGLDPRHYNNPAAAKLLLDRFDKGFTPRRVVDGEQKHTVNIANMTTSEMLDEFVKREGGGE